MDVIEVLKAKTDGMPDEVVITLTTQQGKTLLDQFEAERQRADDAHKYGSERDSENESLMLTVGRLRVEIAPLTGICELLNLHGYEVDGEGVTEKNAYFAVKMIMEQLADSTKMLEAECQRADGAEAGFWGRACARETQRANKAEAELAALKAKLTNPVVLPPVEIGQGACLLCGKLHPTGLQCPMLRVTADKGIL